jgi:gluconokinase
VQQTHILALDIGTSSIRAALYDGNANPVRGAAVRLERVLDVTTDGGAEIDADTAVAQVIATIDALLEKTQKIKTDVGYVASCAFWHSLVGVDAKGKPTTKVLGWADTRSREYSAVLKKRFDENTVHNRTGAHFHSSYWPAKLLWLRKESPEAFARTTLWLSFSDYLALKLFGRPVTGISMASGTGIFDIRKCDWDRELLRYLKINGNLIEPVSPEQTFAITSKYTKRWPRLRDARWFPTIADGAADNIGSDCVTKARAALMLGTSGAMRVAYKGQPPKEIPTGLWCYRIDRERVILGGALSDGGNLYQWLTKNLKLPKDAEAQIAKRSRETHGLTFLPFIAGERSTGYNESARGAILGLTTASDSIDILQAAYEAVAERFADIANRLEKVSPFSEIVASGGALCESPVWKSMIEKTLGHDLTISGVNESSSRGAVLLALETIDKTGTIEDISSTLNFSQV